ncbi:MAG: response regulator [Verrucomicrobiota bacterium]|jgi:DNA-binding response OmpR family regulator
MLQTLFFANFVTALELSPDGIVSAVFLVSFLTNLLFFVRGKILVVEDNADQLEIIRLVLEKEGFAIGTAANGGDALVKTRSILPDLIILDLMLPDINGFDICQTLRKDPRTASVPIIMLTGLSGELDRVAALESGCNEFLKKPLKVEKLISVVDKFLRSRRSSLAGQPG